ncbi:MAG: hypothetical protein V9F01_02615 [Chitinophagaceae bacterium]
MADSTDANSVAEAMIRLKEDKDLCTSLGENAFTGLERSFNKQQFLSDRNDAYAFAIQHRKSNPPVNPMNAFFNR